jgi:hypothetical protein
LLSVQDLGSASFKSLEGATSIVLLADKMVEVVLVAVVELESVEA